MSEKGESLLEQLVSFLEQSWGSPGGFNFKEYRWQEWEAQELAATIRALIIYKKEALQIMPLKEEK